MKILNIRKRKSEVRKNFKGFFFFSGKRSFAWVINSKKGISLGLGLSLSGCMGVYEGGFECPPAKGVQCKSISEVNQMVNQQTMMRTPTLAIEQPELETLELNDVGCGKDHAGSCSLTPEIWYAPWIHQDHSSGGSSMGYGF